MQWRSAVWVVVGVSTVGCTPKPGAVCDHLIELRGAERPMDGDARFQWKQRCIREFAQARDRDASGYRDAARCVMGLRGASQGDAIRACVRSVAASMRVDNARTTAVEAGEIPAPPRPLDLVINPAMDPRTVEYCASIGSRGGFGYEPGTPQYMAPFRECTRRRALEINAQELARARAEREPGR